MSESTDMYIKRGVAEVLDNHDLEELYFLCWIDNNRVNIYKLNCMDMTADEMAGQIRDLFEANPEVNCIEINSVAIDNWIDQDTSIEFNRLWFYPDDFSIDE